MAGGGLEGGDLAGGRWVIDGDWSEVGKVRGGLAVAVRRRVRGGDGGRGDGGCGVRGGREERRRRREEERGLAGLDGAAGRSSGATTLGINDIGRSCPWVGTGCTAMMRRGSGEVGSWRTRLRRWSRRLPSDSSSAWPGQQGELGCWAALGCSSAARGRNSRVWGGVGSAAGGVGRGAVAGSEKQRRRDLGKMRHGAAERVEADDGGQARVPTAFRAGGRGL
ncbi:uncharacterized protein A4U43_C07F27190 [Asparagus officinalis]|uniref:Uncharacterized protein n=1 Tax=Asparagus officinalis TaxID=4686 RepID=A0A5P1EFK1_ASPOF|nr:uncharacterized protein A4U43_C07F27190 [Asparagus officinalis]